MLILSSQIATQVPPSSRAAADVKAARTGTAEQAEDPAVGTNTTDQRVQLFQAGCKLTTTIGVPVEEEDKDIPQELRPMMKIIHELKKKIKEELRELQEAMRSSDPGAKEARVSESQRELQQLNSALQTATAVMVSAIKEVSISDPAPIMKVMGSRQKGWGFTVLSCGRGGALSNHPGEALPVEAGQVAVERHADRTHQQASGRRDVDVLGVQADQAIGGETFEVGSQLGEIAAEVDTELRLDILEGQFEMADQLLDHRAPHPVVAVAAQAATDRRLAVIEAGLVVVDVTAVLAVEVTGLADYRDPEIYQVAVPVGGAALEITLQDAVFLGADQLVVGQGEVTHADIAVARRGESFGGALERSQLLARARQVVGVDPLPRHEVLGQVGIVGHREAIRL